MHGSFREKKNRGQQYENCLFYLGHGSGYLFDSDAADDNFSEENSIPFLQDFLYYIPYAVLSAMTIPAVFYATGDFPSAIAATVIAVVLAWNGLPLIVVALAASGTALLASLIEQWI